MSSVSKRGLCLRERVLSHVIEVGPDAGVGGDAGVEFEVVGAGGEGDGEFAEIGGEGGFGGAAYAAVGVGDVDLGLVREVKRVAGGDDVGEEGLVGGEVGESGGAGSGGACEDGTAVPGNDWSAGIAGAGFPRGADGGDDDGVEAPYVAGGFVAGVNVVHIAGACLGGAEEDFASGEDAADVVVDGDECAQEDGAGGGIGFFPHVVVGLFVSEGVADGDDLVIDFGIDGESGVDLAEVASADGEPGVFFGFAEGGEENCDEQCDDRDDDEEFDEGETRTNAAKKWGHTRYSAQ
jgi:hypothetical protein